MAKRKSRDTVFKKAVSQACGSSHFWSNCETSEENVRRPSRILKVAVGVSLAVGWCVVSPTPAFAEHAIETIDTQAYGTSTQLGNQHNVKIFIYAFSTQQDWKVLMDAFQEGGNDGLVATLSKMKAVGRIQMAGTPGYDLVYIREIVTPTGRQIQFVTNRRITFKEAYRDTRSQSYNLTAGQINLMEQDKSKSDGFLYPAAQLGINTDGQLQFDLIRN